MNPLDRQAEILNEAARIAQALSPKTDRERFDAYRWALLALRIVYVDDWDVINKWLGRLSPLPGLNFRFG